MTYVSEAVRLAPAGRYLEESFDELAAAGRGRPGPAPDADGIARSVVERGGLVVVA